MTCASQLGWAKCFSLAARTSAACVTDQVVNARSGSRKVTPRAVSRYSTFGGTIEYSFAIATVVAPLAVLAAVRRLECGSPPAAARASGRRSSNVTPSIDPAVINTPRLTKPPGSSTRPTSTPTRSCSAATAAPKWYCCHGLRGRGIPGCRGDTSVEVR